MKSKYDFFDYEYMSGDEAAYQGYDTDDEDFRISDELSVMEDDAYDDYDDEAEDGDITETEAEEADEDTDDSSDEIDDWNETDDSDDASDEHVSGESYTLNGQEYKDPRKYIQAIYRMDVSRSSQLDAEEQLALARVIRRGLLCDCNIIQDNPEAYNHSQIENAGRMLRRLKQTDEEKAWVEGLTEDAKQKHIADGRAAQEKLISHSLPLVMDIAGSEHNRMEFLDRVQAGNEGLIKAVQYFNPDKGVRFATFATYLIRNEIRSAAREMTMQSAAPKTWENVVPTEDIIDALCGRMGGQFWLREITVDTDQTIEEIRKQVGILLEQKVHAESIANDIVLGRPQSFDEILEEADGCLMVKADQTRTAEDEADSDYAGRRPRFDIIKGDGMPPKNDEMSIEDYVRLFFAAVIEAKTITPVKLAGFIVEDMKLILRKTDLLKAFLDDGGKYTEDAAISDLRQLIVSGNIWPERHMLNQARSWGWKDLTADTRDERRDEFADYIDPEHMTESTVLILQEGYIALRQQDILEDASITLEYYNWLREILSLTVKERLDDEHRIIFEGMIDRKKYRELQDKHHLSPNTIAKRKEEVCRRVYDQIVESGNCENGDALMKCLTYRYQLHVIGRWKKYVIDRIVRDHYVDRKRFALRSRHMDAQRPPMERFSYVITSVVNSVGTAAEMLRQSYDGQAIRSVKTLANIFSSDAFREIMAEWEAEADDWDEADGYIEDGQGVVHAGDAADNADASDTVVADHIEEKHDTAMAKAV